MRARFIPLTAAPAFLLFAAALVRGDAASVALPPAPAAAVGAVAPLPGLTWDAETKEVRAVAGQAKARFQFCFTNNTTGEVVLQSAHSSCFCTVADLPHQPWVLARGSNGVLEVNMDLAGKRGTVEKAVFVLTSVGQQTLRVRVEVPESAPTGFAVGGGMERLNNQQQALRERQKVVTSPDCVQCHAEPARGKSEGRELYTATCAICHDAANRAAMVPDLRHPRTPLGPAQWRQWIAHGRAGSMMPAFAQSEGGPLTEAQVDALVAFVAQALPTAPGGASQPLDSHP